MEKRSSKQRECILKELRNRNDHPGAEDIYLEVRKQLPHISLGTVYRNLEQLSEMGKILKLEHGGSQKRFDARLEPHAHFRCVACGAVEDVPFQVPVPTLGGEHPWLKKREIRMGWLEFKGLCPACKPDVYKKQEENL